MKIYLLILVTFAATLDKSFGQEFTVDNGNHDLMFDSVDIQIIKKANDILINESVWSKEDDRKCQDDIDSNKYSLFCALYKASIDIIGEYDHRKPALQQIRWIIDSQYKERLAGHRLMDFNNHINTNFDEIKGLLAESIKIIEKKIAED
jgi:hypothetical protein